MNDLPIQILAPLIAERIAAGEVIERPASVIKELVENSLDAKATQIEIRLGKGGTELIHVTDNGTGMARANLEISVCRHATSKIHELDDLMRLDTLGFRGEALPSIASIAELSITSRTAGSENTFEIRAAHTAPQKAISNPVPNYSFLGNSHGTVVKVTGLFSQIPARLKFLKSPTTETSAVREVIERLAIAHPTVGFTLISDDRTLLNLAPNTLLGRAEKMLTDDNPFDPLECRLDGAWAAHLIWFKGLSSPNLRSMIQIVNGRTLRDRILQQAILQPLRQHFLPGSFPVIVVKLDIPPSELDVNVHPNKTEIRFLDSRKIFSICQAAIEKMIHESTPRELWGGTSTVPIFSPNPYADTPTRTSFSFEPVGTQTQSPFFQSPIELGDLSPFGNFKGILFQTYLVFEREDELLWVDQHAAHERIRYEKLRKQALYREQIESQELLVPEVIKVDADDLRALTQGPAPRIELLNQIGFQVEVFGEESLLFRALPSIWGTHQLTERLRNLITRLLIASPESGSIEPTSANREWVWDERLFEKVAMEACRSSVKAGDRLTETGAIELTKKLFECEAPGNCPHGRPTHIKISKQKVEEWFLRKI